MGLDLRIGNPETVNPVRKFKREFELLEFWRKYYNTVKSVADAGAKEKKEQAL